MIAGRLERTDAPINPMSHVWRRRVAKSSRWLHIYLSMFSCVVVLFFAATGLTLNHPEWFADHEVTTMTSGQLDLRWTSTSTTDVAKLEVVEYLRRAHALSGAVTDFIVDDTDASVSLAGPGYVADVRIDRDTGRYDLMETRLGFVAIANDLHKGRDTGPAWKVTIDIAAILLSLISLTGLVLLYFMHRHKLTGYLLVGLGGLVTWGVYASLVP